MNIENNMRAQLLAIFYWYLNRAHLDHNANNNRNSILSKKEKPNEILFRIEKKREKNNSIERAQLKGNKINERQTQSEKKRQAEAMIF